LIDRIRDFVAIQFGDNVEGRHRLRRERVKK
jgi:hypothetical protein